MKIGQMFAFKSGLLTVLGMTRQLLKAENMLFCEYRECTLHPCAPYSLGGGGAVVFPGQCFVDSESKRSGLVRTRQEWFD